MLTGRSITALKVIERIETLDVEPQIGILNQYVRPNSLGKKGSGHVGWHIFYAGAKGVEMKQPGCLCSLNASGVTAEDALNALWWRMTTYDDENLYLVVDGFKDTRRAVQWTQHGWKVVNENLPR